MKYALMLPIVLLCGCNSIYIQPNTTIDKNKDFYANRGGYTIKRTIKQALQERGYNVKIGKVKTTIDNDEFEGVSEEVPSNNAYIVRVNEREEVFRPVWCMFNGFWWWRFNVSIVDQDTKQEIVSWRGRGCANSSMRKLNQILDTLGTK